MLILVTGGAASGKSEHAERLVCEKAQSRLYLATMQPFGKSAEARIARHRALRAGKGFATVERTLDLANLRLSRQYDGILLEDLGNLLANELFAPEGAGAGSAFDSIVAGVDAGYRFQRNLCGRRAVSAGDHAVYSDFGRTAPEINWESRRGI